MGCLEWVRASRYRIPCRSLETTAAFSRCTEESGQQTCVACGGLTNRRSVLARKPVALALQSRPVHEHLQKHFQKTTGPNEKKKRPKKQLKPLATALPCEHAPCTLAMLWDVGGAIIPRDRLKQRYICTPLRTLFLRVCDSKHHTSQTPTHPCPHPSSCQSTRAIYNKSQTRNTTTVHGPAQKARILPPGSTDAHASHQNTLL